MPSTTSREIWITPRPELPAHLAALRVGELALYRHTPATITDTLRSDDGVLYVRLSTGDEVPARAVQILDPAA